MSGPVSQSKAPLTGREVKRIIRAANGWPEPLLDQMAKDEDNYLAWQRQRNQLGREIRPETDCRYPAQKREDQLDYTSATAQSEVARAEHGDSTEEELRRERAHSCDGYPVKRPLGLYECQIEMIVDALRHPLIFEDAHRRAGLYTLLERFLAAPFPDVEATNWLRRGRPVRPDVSTSQSPASASRRQGGKPFDIDASPDVHRSNGGDQ